MNIKRFGKLILKGKDGQQWFTVKKTFNLHLHAYSLHQYGVGTKCTKSNCQKETKIPKSQNAKNKKITA